jgi:hypothetical protein
MKKVISRYRLLILLFFFILLSLFLFFFKSDLKTKKAENSSLLKIEKEIYQIDENSYGYKILINGKVYINQPHKPAIQGVQKMTKKEAERLSDLVVEKLTKNPNELPTISVDEVKKIEEK